jgi:allantoin racemase
MKTEHFEHIKKVIINCIEEDGADAICFGCMAFLDYVTPISETLSKSHPGVIVINPGQAAFKLAELIIGMNLSHSKKSYPFPNKQISLYNIKFN